MQMQSAIFSFLFCFSFKSAFYVQFIKNVLNKSFQSILEMKKLINELDMNIENIETLTTNILKMPY